MIKVQIQDKAGIVLQYTNFETLPQVGTTLLLKEPFIQCKVTGHTFVQSSNDFSWSYVIKVENI